MPVILTPAVALRYLLQLSTDVRAALVLGGDGRVLAGDEALAGPARQLLGVLDDAVAAAAGVADAIAAGAVDAAGAAGPADDAAAELLVRLTRDRRRVGSAHVVRGPDGVALVVAAGPLALLPLLRYDLVSLSSELSGAGPDPSAGSEIPAGEVLGWDASRRVQALDGADSAARTAIFAGLGLLDAGRP